jgi:hypothetical protein
MWIFTSRGFISVVADRGSTDMLLVRARADGHIQHLFPRAKVFQMDDADYRYRALVSRKVAQQVIAKLVESMAYDNFKNSIAEPRYHDACRDVWAVMHGLQSQYGHRKN